MYYPFCAYCPVIPMTQLDMVCYEIDKEMIFDSRVAVVKGVQITVHALRRALAIINRLPYSGAKQAAKFIEDNILKHMGAAGTILSESLAAQIAVFLNTVLKLDKTKANDFANIIVNIITTLI